MKLFIVKQVFRRLLDKGTLAGRPKQFLLCATLLTLTFIKGFWWNFHRSFVIKCPGAYCKGFVIFFYLIFLFNYGPLFLFSLYRIYMYIELTFLKGFWPNFHRSFIIKCPCAYCCVLWFHIFYLIMALCFFPYVEYIYI
jgi:hypothetical protein